MKIPVIDDRFNFTTQKVEKMSVDIMADLKQEAISVLSMVTQCDTNVVLESPVKLRTIAGFDYYCSNGEFSSGDAYGTISFSWTVRQIDPQYYDVNKISIKLGELGWCDIDWRSHNAFLDRMTQEYQLFLEANKFVPKRYAEIEDILEKIRALDMPKTYHDQVTKLVDKVSALLGNATGKKEPTNGK